MDDWCDGVVVVLPAGVSPFDSSAVFAVLIGTTCRYVEGVEVLYATNTFRVCTNDLDRNPLVDYIPTPYLSLVTSLDWIVDPPCCLPANAPVGTELWKVVRTLPITALPNLQKLYIGFKNCVVFWGSYEAFWRLPRGRDRWAERDRMYTERILIPLDMLISTGIADGLRDLEIGLPFIAYFAHLNRGTRQKVKIDWLPRTRVWRSVDQGKEEHGTRGYWVTESVRDWDEPVGFLVDTPWYWM